MNSTRNSYSAWSAQPVEPRELARASSVTTPPPFDRSVWPKNSSVDGTPVTWESASPAGAVTLLTVWVPCFQSMRR